MSMKRRDALKALGGIGAAASMARFLPGCGSSDDGDSGPSGITTYVYVMLENRSYDHYFGARKLLEGKPGDGLVAGMSNPDRNGDPIPLFRPTREQLCAIDPPHGWADGRAQWNAGRNDGFVRVHQEDHNSTTLVEPMQFLTREELPISWALADAYGTSDRWFCSVMGPTWPNRFYWHSGTSGGINRNDLPGQGLPWPSIYHRLQAKGIDWAYFYGSIAAVTAFWGPDASLLMKDKVRRFVDPSGATVDFFAAAAAGTLPPVVYIDPFFYGNDDHPPIHPIHGQELIASIYNALAASPQWKNCMMVVTYDENGGFFDHVSPPKVSGDAHASAGFDQLGFRVPALVVGPYVKEGHVSSLTYEHCSALRELEVAFELEPLNDRTRMARDLSDFIDMERLANNDPRPPITLPPVDVTQWPMDRNACSQSGSLIVADDDHPVHAWANLHPERVADTDLRAERPQYMQAIRDFVARTSGVKGG